MDGWDGFFFNFSNRFGANLAFFGEASLITFHFAATATFF
jgi:hypothetical protein